VPWKVLLFRAYRKLRADRKLGVGLATSLVAISILGNAICFWAFDGQQAGASFADALWYSIISITTIGYGDISAQSLGARLGTIFFVVLLGLATFTILLSMIVDTITSLAMKGQFGMGIAIAHDHCLLVNFPSEIRVKRLIAELKSDPHLGGHEIVVVTNQVERLPFEIDNVLFIHGSPLERETYERAGLGKAALALVLATREGDPASDAVVSSAVSVINAMRPDVRIVAECLDEKHDLLFDAVNCSAVVHGTKIMDHLLVQEVADPGVSMLVEVITSNIVGTTVFSTAVGEVPAGLCYNTLAKALLDADINLMAANRDNQSRTSFRDLPALRGDHVLYIAQTRLDWTELLAAAGL